MSNTYLSDLEVFIEVSKTNGFRAAANNLRVSPGSVSQAIQRLEESLSVRLVERTTRRVGLTSAGSALFERALPALISLKGMADDISEDENEVTGVLKLSAPRDSAMFFLDDLLQKYSRAFPKVGIQVMYQDQKIDLVTSGVDAVIRSQTLLDNDTHAVEIGPELEMALVASPAYLQTHSTPKTLDELTQHNGICFAFGDPDKLAPWQFSKRNKPTFSVNPKIRVITNSLTSLANYAVSGVGIAYLYKEPVREMIHDGRLISLFEQQMPIIPRYTINYLTKRLMPKRLRAFIDLAKQDLK